MALNKIIWSLLVFVFLSAPCLADEMSIPLTVHEALRKNVKGIDRISEPVTVGLPLPEGVIKEKNGIPQLFVDGAEDYQFRTLKKWPDGSVQWALVDFQTDVNANRMSREVKVKHGSGQGNEKLATEDKQYINIETGVMSVKINRAKFALFDNIRVAGTELLSSSQKGIVLVDGNGTEYLSSNDKNVNVSIEENGPVRAVVKVEGSHVSDGKKLLDYTARMHFYKNKSRIRLIYTLRNASKKHRENSFIKSLNLVSKFELKGKPNITVNANDRQLIDNLGKNNENISFYQAVSDFPQEYRGNSFFWRAPIPPVSKTENKSWNKRSFKQEGYWIKKNKEIVTQGKRSEYPDLAFINMSDENGIGVTVGIRFSAGWWPKALRAKSDATVEVGLWPKENNVGYWIRHGSHNTFEVLYDFNVKKASPADAMKRFQYPLVAKADPEWYNQGSNGMYPLYNFVSFSEEAQYVKDMGWDYKVGGRNPKMKVWRYHYWGLGGFLNQHDFARISLVNFLKEKEKIYRAGDYYLYADTRFNYNADWAVYHSDDYDREKMQPVLKKNKDKGALPKVIFEIEHMHWYGMPLYYYMTGDERIREAILDWAEILRLRAGKHYVLVYQRFFGWQLYSLAAMYEFTGDSVYMRMADKIFKRLLSSTALIDKKYWSSLYINWNRGYILRGKKLKPGLMTGYIVFDGLYNYYLQMDDDNPLRERVADVLEGLSDFMYKEPYVEGIKKSHKGKHWAFWLPYIYNVSDKSKSRQGYRLIQEALYVNLAPYLLNGDTKWLTRMDNIVRSATWDLIGMWEGFGYIDHPGMQAILHTRINSRSDNTPPSAIQDLSVSSNSKNSVLKWTVPADAVRYQIKYSKKRIVESLNFDSDNRKYQFHPNEYMNWWASENVADEPNPDPSEVKQYYKVKNIPEGEYFFAIRSWDASNNRSKISNIVEVNIN